MNLLIIIGLMSRATFAIGRGFLSASRLMDDREWPQERRASFLTPPSDMRYAEIRAKRAQDPTLAYLLTDLSTRPRLQTLASLQAFILKYACSSPAVVI